MVGNSYLAAMADIHVAKGPAQFTCLGLGSCIGLVLHDAASHVTGMVHIMLPEAFANRTEEKLGKFADTGVPAVLELMRKQGADVTKLVAAIAGGAQVFKFGAGTSSVMQIGDRNTVATKAQLTKVGIKLIAEDVGGNLGRTMVFDSETGVVKVRSVSQGERVLCRLKG